MTVNETAGQDESTVSHRASHIVRSEKLSIRYKTAQDFNIGQGWETTNILADAKGGKSDFSRLKLLVGRILIPEIMRCIAWNADMRLKRL